jgi:arginine N-succinyltransferase
LLAKTRLLFIAEFADRFAPKVIAELRGRLDADGRSPFWEGLGRHFFVMEYSRADYLTGIGQKAFIAELMPRHPVYTTLLPAEARAVIGEVHADSQPARAMLESEGFRYEGYVDIFDAGPTLECFRDNIRAVRQSEILPVAIAEENPVPDSLTEDVLWLVASRDFERFRAIVAPAPARIARFPLLPHAAAALGVSGSDTVRAVPLSPRDRLLGSEYVFAALDPGNRFDCKRKRTLTPWKSTSTGCRGRHITTAGWRAATSPPSVTGARSPIRARRHCRGSPR